MHVWLVDFDGKMENLALMQLSAWHKAQGDTVILKRVSKGRKLTNFKEACPPLFDRPDKVYISCLFRWNAVQARLLQLQWGEQAELGGTGVNIKKRLPAMVEDCEPDYGLYSESRAIGFISRGCPNCCPWCVVWRKEGQISRVSSAAAIAGNWSEVVFLDNNFLAMEGHETDLHWLVENGTSVDFNQGLDAKYITPTNAELLARCNWDPAPRFALDADGRIPVVKRALSMLAGAGMKTNNIMLYVLIGFHGLESDIRRLLQAREWGVRAFPMGFRNLETGNEPATGWDRRLYNKYRRLITRVPHGTKVWEDFQNEVVNQ